MGLAITQLTNYGQKKADIDKRLLMAKLLQKNVEENTQNQPQVVSGRVVPINPLATALNGITGGYANYQADQALSEQGALEDERRNNLVKALSGGQQITPEIIANAGGDADDILKMAIAQRSNSALSGPVYDYLNTSKGVLRVDKRSKDAELLPYNMATADPALQGDISLQKNINKIGPVVGEDEATRYMTYGQAAGMSDATSRPNFDNPWIDGIWNNESSQGNDPNLSNPNSSAKGPYQITNETRQDWGLSNNSTPDQDRSAVERVQQERADKYGSMAMAALSHMTGEGRMNEIQQGSPLKPEEINYLGKLVAYAYQKEKGTRSPTRQEKDAAQKKQELDVAAGKNELENQQKIQQSEQKKEKSAENMLKITSEPYQGKTIEQWINEATGSGVGTGVDATARFFGKSTQGAQAQKVLETIQGWLVANVPRMEGPQSDFDVRNYQQMASDISNPNITREEKLQSFQTMRQIMQKYANQQPETEIPKGLQPGTTGALPPDKASRLEELKRLYQK